MLADPALPFPDLVSSPEGRLELFNRAVLPIAYPGRQSTSVEIARMTYRPERKCVILYALHLDEPAGGKPRWASATFAGPGRLREILERRGRADRFSSADTTRPAVHVPEYRCLVEFFPTDWKLPSLVRAVEPRGAASILSQVDGGPSSSPPDEVAVLGYRPHQCCVLRYAGRPASAGGSGVVIAKLFGGRGKAADAYGRLEALHARATARGVIVPKPLALIHDGNLVVTESVPGSCMKRRLNKGCSEREAGKLARLAAVPLARLHGLGPEDGEPRTLEREIEAGFQAAARLRRVAPELVGRADALLARVASRAGGGAAEACCLIHGDYSPNQLLLDGDRVAVVDFDRSGPGDPALDVGHFMAELRREALHTGNAALRELPTRFLAEYEAHAEGPPLAERAFLFQSLALVRMALRAFWCAPDPRFRDSASSSPDPLLNEAAACLAEG